MRVLASSLVSFVDVMLISMVSARRTMHRKSHYVHSSERATCKTVEILDASVFPPEIYPNSVVRLAFANVPLVKDFHVRVGEIYIESIDMQISVARKSDSVFTFKLTGRDGRPHAHLKAFAGDVDFGTPHAEWAEAAADVFSEIEQFLSSITSIATFGYFTKKGRLDELPIEIELSMSADFTLADDGSWALVEDSARQHVKLNIGNGGALMFVINGIIKAAGEMPKIFFDSVWPAVKLFIPPNVGLAFQNQPYSSGKLSVFLDIDGNCHVPARKGCGTEELDLKIKVEASVNAALEPIVREAARTLDDGSIIALIAKGLRDAYNQGLKVKGSGSFNARVDLYESHNMQATCAPDITVPLPVPVISRIVGPDLALQDFLPEHGQLSATVGHLDAGSSRAHLEMVSLSHLRLPINDDAFSIDDVLLEELTVEIEDDDEKQPTGIFDNDISVMSKSMQLQLGRESGLTMGTVNTRDTDSALILSVGSDDINSQLDSVGKQMQVPVNIRKGSAIMADGALPKEFQPPLTEERAFLDLSSALKEIVGKLSIRLDKGNDENTAVTVRAPFNTTVRVNRDLIRGLMDSQQSDLGYAYVSTPVQFRKMRSLALLSCGSLNIYSEIDEDNIFEKAPTASLDLATVAGMSFVKEALSESMSGLESVILPLVSERERADHFACCCKAGECFAVDKKDHGWQPHWFTFNPNSCGWLMGSNWHRTELLCDQLQCVRFGLGDSKGKVMCGNTEKIMELRHAVALQVARFVDVASKNTGVDSDGTWFKTFDPYDLSTIFPSRDLSETRIATPRSVWLAASRPISIHDVHSDAPFIST